MYLYCVFPTIAKSTKQLPHCLKITETSVVLIVFNDVSAYTLPFLSVALHESCIRNALLGPWLDYTKVYLTPFISTQNDTIAWYFFFFRHSCILFMFTLTTEIRDVVNSFIRLIWKVLLWQWHNKASLFQSIYYDKKLPTCRIMYIYLSYYKEASLGLTFVNTQLFSLCRLYLPNFPTMGLYLKFILFQRSV